MFGLSFAFKLMRGVGGLAGAFYGIDAIPKRWVNGIVKKNLVLRLAGELVDMATSTSNAAKPAEPPTKPEAKDSEAAEGTAGIGKDAEIEATADAASVAHADDEKKDEGGVEELVGRMGHASIR